MLDRLSATQRELVSSLTTRLGSIPGVAAVVLGGSHARGRALPGSDIDLGLLYSEFDPFSIQSVRALAAAVNDTSDPVVTGFYEWGPWVNGGAWLTIGGQRVDFIYRNLEHVARVIGAAEAGRATSSTTCSSRPSASSARRISGKSPCVSRCSIPRRGSTN